MYPHTKFGIPTSKNIGDMDRTRKRDGRTDGRTDGLTDGRTVRLLYASQSTFGGIKIGQFNFQTYSIIIQGSMNELLTTLLHFAMICTISTQNELILLLRL